MTVEERLEKLEKAWGAQDTLVRELRDAVTVTAHLEAQQGRIVKQHGEWLESLDAARAEAIERGRILDERMDAFAREAAERGRDLDQRIAKLVSGMGAFMRGERP